MEFESLVVDNDYVICKTYPHIIKRKSTGRIVSEHYHKGYIRLNLNCKKYYKHDVIALQWIKNDDPEHKTEIDHKNHIPDDNRIENLEWSTHGENMRNKTIYKGREVEYVDELSDEAFEVTEYNEHEFEDVWFDPETNCFYYYTGAAYRELTYQSSSKNGLRVTVLDINHVQASITLNKFKRIYGIS